MGVPKLHYELSTDCSRKGRTVFSIHQSIWRVRTSPTAANVFEQIGIAQRAITRTERSSLHALFASCLDVEYNAERNLQLNTYRQWFSRHISSVRLIKIQNNKLRTIHNRKKERKPIWYSAFHSRHGRIVMYLFKPPKTIYCVWQLRTNLTLLEVHFIPAQCVSLAHAFYKFQSFNQ